MDISLNSCDLGSDTLCWVSIAEILYYVAAGISALVAAVAYRKRWKHQKLVYSIKITKLLQSKILPEANKLDNNHNHALDKRESEYISSLIDFLLKKNSGSNRAQIIYFLNHYIYPPTLKQVQLGAKVYAYQDIFKSLEQWCVYVNEHMVVNSLIKHDNRVSFITFIKNHEGIMSAESKHIAIPQCEKLFKRWS